MRAPETWKKKARAFKERVLTIEDESTRFAAVFILEALNDPEDDCCFAVFAAENDLRIEGFALDADIGDALAARVGAEAMPAAVRWLQDELAGEDPAWAAWLLHRVKTLHHPELHEIVSRQDGVVYDIEKKRITKKLKR